MFGVSLTGHSSFGGVGSMLRNEMISTALRLKVFGALLESRVLGSHAVRDEYTIQEWVYGDGGVSWDPQVRYYQERGFKKEDSRSYELRPIIF